MVYPVTRQSYADLSRTMVTASMETSASLLTGSTSYESSQDTPSTKQSCAGPTTLVGSVRTAHDATSSTSLMRRGRTHKMVEVVLMALLRGAPLRRRTALACPSVLRWTQEFHHQTIILVMGGNLCSPLRPVWTRTVAAEQALARLLTTTLSKVLFMTRSTQMTCLALLSLSRVPVPTRSWSLMYSRQPVGLQLSQPLMCLLQLVPTSQTCSEA